MLRPRRSLHRRHELRLRTQAARVDGAVRPGQLRGGGRRAPCRAAMSSDCGPTLLEWMERCAPGSYAGVGAAGRGGGAVAMPYHHLILPLAPRRDKVTEVRWGIADFRRRFGREPEGMWLPETAVDDETLDVLAA